MKENVSETTFVDRFEQMDRGNNFSYEGRIALYNYLTDLEEDTGKEIEFDVIAICCDYTEYENIEEFWKDYNKEEYPDFEKIGEHTTIIKIDDKSFIIQGF